MLTSAAKHFFEKRHGKRFRPTIVMLMCKWVSADRDTFADVAESLTCLSVALIFVHTARALMTQDPIQYKRQSQLGQITEMIHVARYESSLLRHVSVATQGVTPRTFPSPALH